jgi:transposase-like protein
MNPMTRSKEIKDKYVELRAEGITIQKAAKELGIANNTAGKWEKSLKSRIADLENLRLQESQQKYLMTKERRIELYGERLLAIKEELSKRDLSDISTPKLFDMLIKCSNVLQTEYVASVSLSKEPMHIKLTWGHPIPFNKKFAHTKKESDALP